MKTFLSPYVQSFHYHHPVTKLTSCNNSQLLLGLPSDRECLPPQERKPEKGRKWVLLWGKAQSLLLPFSQWEAVWTQLRHSMLIVLFSSLFQNLKVSSQTNFLSRAWWFPIFYFFEKNVQGSIPCCFSWPLSWPPGCFKSSCKKYSRVQKMGEDNEKST